MRLYADAALTDQSAISVAGLTDYIRAVLEEDAVLRQVWVVGEVSSAKRHTVGLFFTLKDLSGEETINCVVWRNQIGRLTSLPKPGEQVIALGTIKIYPQRSSYQLMVWQVLPGGDGLRSLRYRQLKQRLEAEGLFDPAHKRPLPAYPQAIAVVTSPQAAAWGDIQRSLRQHHPGLQVLFSGATVQGDLAPPAIVRAIDRVVADGRAEVLILARGGGAVEDLECFNDERVVRAVATCPIPVVTGIGHERDESLADLAADVCAHTPTAAAVTAVPSLDRLVESHRERIEMLRAIASDRLQAEAQILGHLRQRLQRLRLDRQIHQEQTHLQQIQQRLIHDLQMELQQAQQRCAALKDQLASLDPTAVLRRGYALIRDERQQLVSRIDQVTVGQPLTVQLHQGWLTAEVKALHEAPEAPNGDPQE